MAGDHSESADSLASVGSIPNRSFPVRQQLPTQKVYKAPNRMVIFALVHLMQTEAVPERSNPQKNAVARIWPGVRRGCRQYRFGSGACSAR
jgi:hypothetical protein